MCDYLKVLLEYRLRIAKKNNKSPIIDPRGTPQIMGHATENSMSNETKQFCLCGKNETVFSHLKNRCTSFCLIKFYDHKSQKSSKDQLKSFQIYFPFSAPLKIISVE